MILVVVRPSSIGPRDEDLRWSNRFVRLATWAAVAWSVAQPMIRLYDIAVLPTSLGGISGRAMYAAVAVASYLPVQVWLVLSATRGPLGRRQRLGLAALAAVMVGMIPVVGVGWVGILYMLAALVLVAFRPPWSLLPYAALVAAPLPLTLALGQPEWAAYFTVGMLIFSVPLAIGIWLIRGVRQLQDARLELAEQAVVRERQRIDGEVRESVGVRLTAIVAQGRRVGEMAAEDPAGAVPELRVLIDDARRTLAETRRMVTRYREVSLLAELETVATLLSAAGIDTHLDLPPELPDAVDEEDRESLRRDVADLLGEIAPADSVTIAVTPHRGRPRIELRTGSSPAAAEVAAR
jgi:signal transduction histidine kinase